jgi:predicted dehydrogenase
MFRACVIGLGSAGRAHAAAYRGDDRAQLVGVCDRDAVRAQAVAARLRVPAFNDAAEMLRSARPDLVSICIAEPCALVAQALEARCDLLAEPPLAPALDQARTLVATAKANNLCLAADLNLRFTPAAVRARQWLDDGRLGAPLFANLALWAETGAGTDADAALRRLACHGFDLLREWCGDVARLHCFIAETPTGGWSAAQVNIEHTNNIVSSLTVSRDMPARHPMARFEIAGTTARLLVDNIYEEITLYPHAQEEKTVITNSIFGGLGRYDDTYACRVRRLLEQLAAGVAPHAIEGSGEDALAAQALVDAAMESAKSNRVISLR